MHPDKIKEIFKRLHAQNPTPKTELNYNSPFELLVAVILSAQATDVSVNKATAHLFKVANTPAVIFNLGEEKLKDYIKSIGLFNMKAKHIIQTCQRLIEQHQSKVPESRTDLEALPGVGRKTANVLLNTLFKQPTVAVDTHIFRVANRTGLAPGRTPLAVEKRLLEIIPKPYRLDAHHWLVLHGRYICTARKAKCHACPINDLCVFYTK